MIHLLEQGFALCGLPGIPRDWPDGHRWVSVDQHKASVAIGAGRPRATCEDCLFVLFQCKLTCDGGSERGSCACARPTECALRRGKWFDAGRHVPRLPRRVALDQVSFRTDEVGEELFAAVELLATLEWQGGDVAGSPCCPSCSALKYQTIGSDALGPHREDCALKKAISRRENA